MSQSSQFTLMHINTVNSYFLIANHSVGANGGLENFMNQVKLSRSSPHAMSSSLVLWCEEISNMGWMMTLNPFIPDGYDPNHRWRLISSNIGLRSFDMTLRRGSKEVTDTPPSEGKEGNKAQALGAHQHKLQKLALKTFITCCTFSFTCKRSWS